MDFHQRSNASTQGRSPHAELPRVLVVDDNPLNRFLASELLSQFGIEPMLAGDGAEAVALAGGHEFDLILMDLQMPVLDGLAATAQIRRLERERSGVRAAVVAYTSTPFSAKHSLLLTFGLDDVLEKPCDAGALKQCLVRWCPPARSAWLDAPAVFATYTIPVDAGRGSLA
jgi:CheY-like chemotaxis protein